MWLRLAIIFQVMTCALIGNEIEKSYTYDLSICAMFKDEAPILEEWIEYHRMLGVEHFYLYNDRSTDNFQKVLEPYIIEGFVELFDWHREGNLHKPHQNRAHCDGLRRARGKSKWVAFVDIDEFIVPGRYDNILDLLHKYEDECVALSMYWQLFGTSGHWNLPPNAMLTENFTWKADKYAAVVTKNYKTIVQVDKIHDPDFFDPDQVVSKNIDLVHWRVWERPQGFLVKPLHIVLDVDDAQINHYWCRDEKFFREVKVPRKEKLNYEHYGILYPWPESKLRYLLEENHQKQDFQIQRFVPELKRRLGR